MEVGEYCVYRLVDPTDSATRYVGSTKNRVDRYKAHLYTGWGEGSRKKQEWTKELRKQGLRPQMVIIEDGLSKECARTQEVRWIRYYQSQGASLFNDLNIKFGHQEVLDLLKEHIDLLSQIEAQGDLQQVKNDLQQRTQSLFEDLSTNYRIRLIPLSQYNTSSKESA